MRPITPPTLKLSVTSSFGPSVPLAVTGRAIASMLTGATRTGTGVSAGGGESARPRLQAACARSSSRVRKTRFILSCSFGSSPPDPLSLRERGNLGMPGVPPLRIAERGTGGEDDSGKRESWGEVAQRGRALQVHVTHSVLVGRDDAVELGRGERGPGVHELD